VAKKKVAELTGAFELFSKSSALVQKNIPTFAVVYLLPFLINLASLRRTWGGSDSSISSFGLFSGLSSLSGGTLFGFGLIAGILVFAVWLVVNALTIGLLSETAKGKKPRLDDLWVFARKFWWKLFVMSFLIAIMTIGGLILLIVPGLIVIRRYFLAPYVLVDQDVGILEAMRRSAAISKPHSGYIWSIIFVSVLLGLPSIIPLVGWAISFILAVLYSTAPALRYQELKHISQTN